MADTRPWGFREYVKSNGFHTVYLIKPTRGCPIKVGITEDPVQRLLGLQNAHFEELEFHRFWWLPGVQVAFRIEFRLQVGLRLQECPRGVVPHEPRGRGGIHRSGNCSIRHLEFDPVPDGAPAGPMGAQAVRSANAGRRAVAVAGICASNGRAMAAEAKEARQALDAGHALEGWRGLMGFSGLRWMG